jgi:hypothetical protein
MVNCINIDDSKAEFYNNLQKTIQSTNLNFLIGSGCSLPAIKALGDIETKIQEAITNEDNEKANRLIFDFLKPFLESTKNLIENSFEEDHSQTLENYRLFLNCIINILFERKSNILHKQATIFTTNYDLFIEKTAEDISDNLLLNDGFKRIPSLSGTFKFSTSEFFNTIYNTGNLYNYQVQIPAINLIKLHGSLNWKIKDSRIIYSLEHLKEAEELISNTDKENVKKFVSLFSLVFPKKDKFNETTFNQTYYDLLRIYANELDKENTLLITEGFSFADEHILELTKRALKNPTLKLILFCFDDSCMESYKNMFAAFNNVDLIYSASKKISFSEFIAILSAIVPNKMRLSQSSVLDEKDKERRDE